MNAVAEIFEAVQGFYLPVLLQEQQVLAGMEQAGLDALWMGCVPGCELSSHRGHAQWPVLCFSAMQNEERSLPCYAGHLMAVSGSFSSFFFVFFFTLLNCGNKAQGDFLGWRLSLPIAKPIVPNLIYSMTS